ncbi:polycomb protein suz12-A [Chironomus tepperi]|uniref:polycomb protein suz12-A n=1 Tax=Chironomus tepperi TaxID=113505 RepID=UPI00391FA621
MPRSRTSDSFKTRKDITPIADTDLFFQTFEKPTQIYRYLKTRFISSPLFLHRTLSYMKGRSSRNNKSRADFKVNDILSTIQNKDQKPNENENLIIGFLSFYDSHLQTNYVKVETKLEKISYKRRKESAMTQNQIRIGESRVIVNTDNNGTDKLPAVCVSATEFDRLGDNVQTTYQLTFDIESQPFTGNTTDEPSNKYTCYSKTYHAELPVFDKHGRNLLINGLYHVTALERHAFRPSHMLCWENFPSEADQHIADWAEEVNKYYFAEEDSNPFVTFDKTPKIQLYMEWTRSKITGNNYIPRPKFITDQHNNNKENTSTVNGTATTATVNGSLSNGHDKKELQVVEKKAFIFQFIVNNSTKQRTEERSDFICPWCSLNCIRIYSLIKHLKLCHARLLFQYVEDGGKARVDVYLNELYDGSYSGAPHDILLGSQRQNGPSRRNVVTNIMVFRPRRPSFKMSEFQEVDDGELEQQRQYISGHNRIYYHSETCIPIMPKELDYDSEGEPDPRWLQRTTKQMIDEFTDVNEGEKELMKLWNLHVMKHGFVGDCQIALACDLFLKEKGLELLEKNLYRNYIVHLSSMFNYGLISPQTIIGNIRRLNEMLKDNQDEFGRLKANRKAHVAKANIKPVVTKREPEKSDINDTKESSNTKVNPKDEKKGGKVDKEKATAKVPSKHNEVNGHTSNSKHKSNLALKRKLSTA